MSDIIQKCPFCEAGDLVERWKKDDKTRILGCTYCNYSIDYKNYFHTLSITPNMIYILTKYFDKRVHFHILISFIILKKLDSILKYSKNAVVECYEKYGGYIDDLDLILKQQAVDENGNVIGFYNFSNCSLNYLMKHSKDLETDLINYISSFSDNISEIFDYFRIKKYIIMLSENNDLNSFLEEFFGNQLDLEFDLLTNSEMESIFEKIACDYSKFSEKEIGEYFLPNDISKLIIKLLFFQDSEILKEKSRIIKIFDPYCRTGKLLINSKKHIQDGNNGADILLYGQESNVELFNICKINFLLSKDNIDKISQNLDILCESFDQTNEFDYIISDLSYLDYIGFNQLFIIQKLISVMKKEEISRMAIIVDENTVGKCNKGSIEEKIRKNIIENDYLDLSILLPDNLFYGNNSRKKYIWLLSNKKSLNRINKVKFIDVSKEFFIQKNSIANKKEYISDSIIDRILQLSNSFENSKNLKILNTADIDLNDLSFDNLEIKEDKIKKQETDDLKLDKLIYPLITNYFTVTKGSPEKSLKVQNYFVLYEFITALNVIVLLSALPEETYIEKKEDLFKDYRYGTMPWGTWINLYGRLGKIYRNENLDVPFGPDFYRKLHSKKFITLIKNFVELRNKKFGHGGASQVKRSESILEDLDNAENNLMDIFKDYLPFQLIYIYKILDIGEKNTYCVVILNGRGACSPDVLYNKFSSSEKLEKNTLYLFNTDTKELLKLKKNLIRFEFCNKCEKWSIYVYNNFKKLDGVIYKSFQHEKHEFTDNSINYEDIFEY